MGTYFVLASFLLFSAFLQKPNSRTLLKLPALQYLKKKPHDLQEALRRCELKFHISYFYYCGAVLKEREAIYLTDFC